MSRGSWRGRASWPGNDLPTEVAEWEELRLADGTAIVIANRVAAVSDDGVSWTLALNDTGLAVGDYPSRQDGWRFAVPADVLADLAAGVAYMLVGEILITGAAPALDSGYTITIGCADLLGAANNSGCVLLGAGMRWAATSIRAIATSRGGGGADVQSGAVTTTIVKARASVMVGAAHLQSVQAVILDAAGDTDDRSVSQQDARPYTAPLSVVMFAGCDSIAGTGPHSLVFRPRVAWLRIPA